MKEKGAGRQRGRKRERERERERERGEEREFTKSSSLNHIHDSPRSADNYLLAHFKFCNICSYVGASNTGMTLGIEVVTQSKHNLRISGERRSQLIVL